MSKAADEARAAAALKPLRAEIDAIDAEIVTLIARRMDVVERVIAVKRGAGIPALLEGRVEEVAAHVRRRAEALGAPADLAETVWRAMMRWVIAYEDRQLSEEAGR